MIPTIMRVNVPFRWSIADGLNGQSMLGRSYGREIAAVISRPSVKRVLDRNGLLVPYNPGSVAVGVRSGVPVVPLELGRSNLALWCRDLTNAAWVKTNMSAALNQVGVDGAANSATLLTATAGNATVLQSITSGSNERITSFWLRRVTGAGSIQITQDNGATWTTVTLGAGFTRVELPAATLANPIIGIRIVTSGDAIVADFAQHELGAAISSEILTTSSTQARSADDVYFTVPGLNPPRTLTFYVRGYNRGTVQVFGSFLSIGAAGTTNPRLRLVANTLLNPYLIQSHNLAGANVLASAGSGATAVGDLVEIRGVLRADGSLLIGASINGGTEIIGSPSGAQALDGAWAGTRIYLNSTQGASSFGLFDFMNVVVAENEQPLAAVRELAGV